jgi:hypothetical protein
MLHGIHPPPAHLQSWQTSRWFLSNNSILARHRDSFTDRFAVALSVFGADKVPAAVLPPHRAQNRRHAITSAFSGLPPRSAAAATFIAAGDHYQESYPQHC